MLPPLNLVESKGGFFSRKRVDGGEPAGNSSARKRSSVKIIRPSPRSSIHVPTPRGSRTSESDSGSVAEPANAHSNRDEISLIPREFFVVETNAVLLPQNYPPNQYKSTLNVQGQWETRVFPALTPNNRQQVLYLRQTLDKMRAAMPRFEDESEDIGPETEADTCVRAERRQLMVEYTGQETQIYSSCFHELARQIKCICKEQSELLYEIRERYDAAVARLIDQFKFLDEQSNRQQDQLNKLATRYQLETEEKNQLAQRVEELEHELKSGPSIAAAQEAAKLCKVWRDETSKKNNGENSDSDIDDEEAEWRRQRDGASVARPTITTKHDSTKDLHLAATRLQGAFQKYQARKEQTRITIKVEKQAAAMDIQRSYRGFRERQLALHRRAVMRTILRRREESAAVELMQANVRAYLLNRRRSAKLKTSTVNSLKRGESDPALFAPAPARVQTPVPAAEMVIPTLNENQEETSKTEEVPDSKVEIKVEAKPNPKQTLTRLLKTFRELASVLSMFHRVDSQSVESVEVISAAENNGDSFVVQEVFPPRPASAAPPKGMDDEDVKLFQQTMLEVQALVGSLHVVLGTVPEERAESDDDSEQSTDDSNARLNVDGAAQTDLLDDLDKQLQNDTKDMGETQQSNMDARSDDGIVDDYDDSSVNIPFGERDAMRLQNYAELNLDDSLWNSAMYYPATRRDMTEAEGLLALALSSREQKKRLVALKQFISDIYDTIVGKLRELPASHLSDLITSRCHLALSFVEWREQRSQLFSRAVTANQPGEQVVSVNFNIEQLIREHFHCRLGLPQLIDAALANLHESIEDFAGVDPDVKRFQEFLSNERSGEEFIFCCMCRYICAHRLSSDNSPAGTASSSYHRQPMFHPVTMREVIDVPHALELAKLLFRVEDESFIVQSDTVFTEVENAVYRQYLPTNGFQQFESIISSFFVDPDAQATAISSINEAGDGDTDQAFINSCRRPCGSPRRASAMVRPTNYNQFHSKQHNTQAPRSPIVRHQQSQPWSLSPATKWVFYEEVLALLIKYRGQMNHFHLFSYWVQELFGLAASPDDTGRSGQVKLLNDAAFVETLAPLSLGPTERELRNIFHNSLRQRKLQVFMPLRVFTSVALLLLRNGLLSVSTYAPMQKPKYHSSTGPRQRSLSIREENEDKEWRSLALKWRTQESAFEAAIEAIYHEPSSVYVSSVGDQTEDPPTNDKTRAAHALQLLQLRQELYDLFASRSGRGRDLKRAYEIYEILVNERLGRVGGDTNMLDGHTGTWPMPSFSYF